MQIIHFCLIHYIKRGIICKFIKQIVFLPLLLDFSLLRFGYEADVKEIIIKNNSIFCEFK